MILVSLPAMPPTSPPELRERLDSSREIVLANALMLGELPAPSGLEEARIRFIADRFTASELQDISVDQKDNIQALIPGRTGKHTILVSAHADTLVGVDPDQRITINVESDHLTGPGLADNTLGLATIASLPELLKRLDIQLDANIILLGHTNSLRSKDLTGLRFFLKNFPKRIHAGVVVEGITLGRLNHFCLGMVQADITCEVHQSPGTRWEASENAIIIMHRVIRRILEIPLPQEPRTSVIIGSVHAGKTFNRPPESARLRLEIRSEMPGKAREIRMRIKEILEEISAETASKCTVDYPALRKPGGIPFSHPMVTAARNVMDELGIAPLLGPSYSDLSILISHKIPALTIGLTTVHKLNEADESVEIEPLFTGIAQLVSLLRKMDAEIDTYSPPDVEADSIID
jgi:acetylornithine deacetylase/succinyl-diaminopimelate desuccinylase-like protein